MSPPREFAGQKALHDHMEEFAGFKDLKVNFLELKVISDGKLALPSSVQHLTGKGADGKPFDITFRVTDLWRKTNGQWKIISAHASFPVDMKTGKADMASKNVSLSNTVAPDGPTADRLGGEKIRPLPEEMMRQHQWPMKVQFPPSPDPSGCTGAAPAPQRKRKLEEAIT
jgi:hypothetical protein